MSIRPESPGEIYEDKNGDRWLVMSMCNEPTVTMQRLLPPCLSGCHTHPLNVDD